MPYQFKPFFIKGISKNFAIGKQCMILVSEFETKTNFFKNRFTFTIKIMNTIGSFNLGGFSSQFRRKEVPVLASDYFSQI